MPQKNDLRGRIAGQSAMAAVIEAQSDRSPRGLLARIVGVSPLTAAGRAHYRGAVGELLVGSILDHLGHSWDVLHGVPLGKTSLDHFAVGRAGVFAISVVNCQGDDVAVNGDELVIAKTISGAITNARASAHRVGVTLSEARSSTVEVVAVLVVVNPVKLSMLALPKDVHILTSMQLEQWLLSSPVVLSGEEVATLSTIAESADTWPPAQEVVTHSRNITRAFVRIHHDVRTASARRFFWVVTALILTFLSVWSLVSVLTELVVTS
ncbi:nuclease-related domain-containing protein [Rhodoglobus sp. NPDC076762]